MNTPPDAPQLPDTRQYKSFALWPEGTLSLSLEAKDTSSDVHGSKEQAEGVCRILEREGFGGERKIFPVKTWVEPIEAVKDTPAVDDSEQAAFENWLADTCPSGDAESVHRKWLESSDYVDWHAERDTPADPKFNLSKDFCLKMADLEGDATVGAGCDSPPVPAQGGETDDDRLKDTPVTRKLMIEQACNYDVPWEEHHEAMERRVRTLERELAEARAAVTAEAHRCNTVANKWAGRLAEAEHALTAAQQDSKRLEWQPIETAPECLPNCPRFMDLRFGTEEDPCSGPGMRWGDSYYAVGLFYRGLSGDPRPYHFRETEVKPTHWRKSLAVTRAEIDAAMEGGEG